MNRIYVTDPQRSFVPFADVFDPLNAVGEAAYLVIAATARLVAGGGRLLARLWQHYCAQQDYAHLLEQSDHLLADIGLTRAAIRAATARPLELPELFGAFFSDRHRAPKPNPGRSA